MQFEVFGVPANTLLVWGAAFMMVLIIFRMAKAAVERSKRRETALAQGRKVPGMIVAVKHQSAFDRQRTAVDPLVKLQYSNPISGQDEIVEHFVPRSTANLPIQIGGPGAGMVDNAGIREGFRDLQAFRRDLASQGYTKQQINDTVNKRLIEQAAERHSVEHDSDGFIVLKDPAPVDVYLSEDNSGPERGIHVVFPAA